MKSFTQRTIALLICVVMVFSVCTTAFAMDEKTEQYAKKAAVAAIEKAAGAIPYVGEGISKIIDTFLPDMFNITDEHDKVMAKLDEIYDSIQNLSLKIDDNQKKLFQAFYQQKIDNFNSDANKLKGTIDRLYALIKETEDYYGDIKALEGDEKKLREHEKQVQLANLIKGNDFGDPSSAIAQLTNLSDYICGTQISTGREDGIFQLAYKANCANSALGCEAALKSASYVRSLSKYIETAYKTIFIIYGAKLYVCENADEISDEMAAGSIPRCDMTDYNAYNVKPIRTSVFGTGTSSVISYYNRMFDSDRSDSAINIYNGMLEEVWFNYIDSTDYEQKPAKITYIPLDFEMGFLYPGDVSFRTVADMNYDYLSSTMPALGKTDVLYAWNGYYNITTELNKIMLDTAHSALSVEQTENLMKHMANNPVFGTDKNSLTCIEILEDLGFSFNAYNAYVDSLPKSSGTTYRDPSKSRALTDGKLKIFPVNIENKFDSGNFFPDCWCGSLVDGYNFQDDPNDLEPVEDAEMVRMCLKKCKTGNPGDYNINNAMIMYFAKAGSASGTGSFFGRLSAWTVPVICTGAAVIIAVPAVILLVRKKKKKDAAKVSE